MKVYLSSLGCKLNESELEAWSRRLASEGHEIVGDPRQADMCILNTCTVTHVAARKSRQMARQLARHNPEAHLVLTGCYASISPDEASKLPNVALIVPNADKDRLVTLAGSLLEDIRFQTTSTGCRMPEAASGSGQWSGDGGQNYAGYPLPAPRSPESVTADHHTLRTRAFVKIMDGCNMSCTYCIIPLARGKERSRPLKEIIAEVRSLVADGFQEIILTGVQISVYANQGDKTHGLRDLTAAILAETPVPRLRLTSIAPWDLDESLLDLWRDSRLCRHIHLSLQSGSDTVLRRMRRAYTTDQFRRVADLARERIPDLGITTDVIVGFPGESDIEFEQSLQFVEEMRFSRVHVFPYSARKGTVAATLPLQVADHVKEARMRKMQAVADKCQTAFAEGFIGRRLDVLWESQTNHSGAPAWEGYTDNYIRVIASGDAQMHNRISPVRLIETTEGGAVGLLAPAEASIV